MPNRRWSKAINRFVPSYELLRVELFVFSSLSRDAFGVSSLSGDAFGLVILNSIPFFSSLQEALRLSEEVISLEPESAEAWFLKGKALFHLTEYLGASDALNKALQHDIRGCGVDGNFWRDV